MVSWFLGEVGILYYVVNYRFGLGVRGVERGV